MYFQNYNPLGNVILSTLVAAIPILVLMYFVARHLHRDRRGVRHLGVAALYAAFYGVLAAFVVSCLAFGMPSPLGHLDLRARFLVGGPRDHLDRAGSATNSTGGVMGKMIDAQSIMVACAACYDDEDERSHALGPIFRTVRWQSVAGAAIIGLIASLQADVFPGMIPVLPPK